MIQASKQATASTAAAAPRASGDITMGRIFVMASLISAVFSVLLMPAPANAGTPMGEVLCFILYIILGNAGRGLATIGIMVLGVAAVLGKASWGLAITVGVGIAVVFSCVQLVSLLGLGDAAC
jgi:type IV secretory pathway VirB2 component (pilin)